MNEERGSYIISAGSHQGHQPGRFAGLVSDKQLTDIDLVGVEQRDMWISPSGQVYVLMVYDAEKFSDAVSSMDNLSEAIRKAVIERADANFRELDEELEKD